MKVAIVYDRVNKWGGAERVLLDLHKIFPEAPLYTSVYNPKSAPWARVFPKVHTSFLNKIPFFRNHHEFLSILMPLAFESFDFSEYELVISVTSEYAKAIITKPETLHICYCLTPTRYLWSGYDQYFDNKLVRFLSSPVVRYLKNYDKLTSRRPDLYVAISSEALCRIKKYYKADSELIYPPLSGDLLESKPANVKATQPYFLLVSRLVKYKNVELAIKVFNKNTKQLRIIGVGSDMNRLKKMANKNIIFHGKLTDEQLLGYYKNCKALIFPQVEDFGLVALEAQYFGKPVIARNKGGVRDTVIDGKTGILFDDNSVESLSAAISKFEKTKFNKEYIISHSEKFSFEVFERKLLKYIRKNL